MTTGTASAITAPDCDQEQRRQAEAGARQFRRIRQGWRTGRCLQALLTRGEIKALRARALIWKGGAWQWHAKLRTAEQSNAATVWRRAVAEGLWLLKAGQGIAPQRDAAHCKAKQRNAASPSRRVVRGSLNLTATTRRAEKSKPGSGRAMKGTEKQSGLYLGNRVQSDGLFHHSNEQN